MSKPTPLARGGSAQELHRRDSRRGKQLSKNMEKNASWSDSHASAGGLERSAIARVAAFAAAGRASLSPHSMAFVSKTPDSEASQRQTRKGTQSGGIFWRTSTKQKVTGRDRSSQAEGAEDEMRPKSSMFSARSGHSGLDSRPRARSAMGMLAGLPSGQQAVVMSVDVPASVAQDGDDHEDSDDRSSVETKVKERAFKKRENPYESAVKGMEEYAQYMEECTATLEDRLQMHLPQTVMKALHDHRKRGKEAAKQQMADRQGSAAIQGSQRSAAAERLDDKLNQFLDNHKRVTSMPKMAVRIQKWWRMTKRWRNYRRFRKSVKLFNQRSLILCIKSWRLTAISDSFFRENLCIKILSGWRMLARNSMIWDEESALIYLECTRIGGLPQRALFLEVNDKNTFRRAGMEHNFGKGYKHGRPLPTREHIIVVQCIRRTMAGMAKLRLRRWRKWVMWKKHQSEQGSERLALVYQHRREEKFFFKFLMWSRFTVVRRCMRSKEEVPEFEPTDAFWDDWYQKHLRKQQLSSDHVLKLQWRFLARNTIIRWTRYQSVEQTKRYVTDQTVTYYARKARCEAFAQWAELAKSSKAVRYRYRVILTSLSQYATKKAGQTAAHAKVVTIWRNRIKRTTIGELRRVAHYMLVIHAGGLHRLRQDHSRALWAAFGWLSWKKRPAEGETEAQLALFDESWLMDKDRLPGGLCSLGVCDAHFHFSDTFRLWASKARRRKTTRSMVLSLFYDLHISGSLLPAFSAWKDLCGKGPAEFETLSKEGAQKQWMEFWGAKERIAQVSNRTHRSTGRGRKHHLLAQVMDAHALWPRLVTMMVKKTRKDLDQKELVEGLTQMSKRERIEHRQKELSVELGAAGAYAATRIPAVRAFANQERQRQEMLCKDRLAGLKRDYKLLLAGELHDLVAAYSGEYDRQHRTDKTAMPFSTQRERGGELFARTGRRGSWVEETENAVGVPRDHGRGRRSSILHSERAMPAPSGEAGEGEVLGGLWFPGAAPGAEEAGGRQRRMSLAESVAEAAGEAAPATTEEAAGEAEPEEEVEAPQSMWEYEDKMEEDVAELTVQERIERSLQLALSDMYGKMLAAATTKMPVGRREPHDMPSDPYFEEDYILRRENMMEDYQWLREDTLGPDNTQPLLKTPEEILEEKRRREQEASVDGEGTDADGAVSREKSEEAESWEAGIIAASFYGIDVQMNLDAESPSMLRASSDGVPRSRPVSAFGEDRPLIAGWRGEARQSSKEKRPPPRRKARGQANMYSEVLAAYAKKRRHQEELELQNAEEASSVGDSLSRVASDQTVDLRSEQTAGASRPGTAGGLSESGQGIGGAKRTPSSAIETTDGEQGHAAVLSADRAKRQGTDATIQMQNDAVPQSRTNVEQMVLEEKARSDVLLARRKSTEARETATTSAVQQAGAAQSEASQGGSSRNQSIASSVDREELAEELAPQRAASSTTAQLLDSVGSWTQQLGAGKAGGTRFSRSRPGSSVTLTVPSSIQEPASVQVSEDREEDESDRLEVGDFTQRTDDHQQELWEDEQRILAHHDSDDGEATPELREEATESGRSRPSTTRAASEAESVGLISEGHGAGELNNELEEEARVIHLSTSRPETADTGMRRSSADQSHQAEVEEVRGPWEEMMDAHVWVREEKRGIQEALRGGLDSLYWRSQVTAKRSRRQKLAQIEIDREYELGRQRQQAKMERLHQVLGAHDVSALQAVLPEHWHQQQPADMQILDVDNSRLLSSSQAKHRPLFQSAAPPPPHPLAGKARGNTVAKARNLPTPALNPVRQQASDPDFEEREFVRIATSAPLLHGKIPLPQTAPASSVEWEGPATQTSWAATAAVPPPQPGRSLEDWMLAPAAPAASKEAPDGGSVPPLPFASPPFHTREPRRTETVDGLYNSTLRRQHDRVLTSTAGLRVPSKGKVATSSVAVRFPSSGSAFVAGGTKAERPAGRWTDFGERPGTSGSQSARSRPKLGKLSVVRNPRPKTDRSDRPVEDLLVAGGRYAQPVAHERSFVSGGTDSLLNLDGAPSNAMTTEADELKPDDASEVVSRTDDGGTAIQQQASIESSGKASSNSGKALSGKDSSGQVSASGLEVGSEGNGTREWTQQEGSGEFSASGRSGTLNEWSADTKTQREASGLRERDSADAEEEDQFPALEDRDKPEPLPAELREFRVSQVDEGTLWRPWSHRPAAEILQELYADHTAEGDEHIETHWQELQQRASSAEGSDGGSAASQAALRRLSSAAMITKDGMDESDLSLLDPTLLDFDYTPSAEIARNAAHRRPSSKLSSPKHGPSGGSSSGGTPPSTTPTPPYRSRASSLLPGPRHPSISRRGSLQAKPADTRREIVESEKHFLPGRDDLSEDPQQDERVAETATEHGPEQAVIGDGIAPQTGNAQEGKGQLAQPEESDGAMATELELGGHPTEEREKHEATESVIPDQDVPVLEQNDLEPSAEDAENPSAKLRASSAGAAHASARLKLRGMGVAGAQMKRVPSEGKQATPSRAGKGEDSESKDKTRRAMQERAKGRWGGVVALQHEGEAGTGRASRGPYLTVHSFAKRPPRPVPKSDVTGAATEAGQRRIMVVNPAKGRMRGGSLEPEALKGLSGPSPLSVGALAGRSLPPSREGRRPREALASASSRRSQSPKQPWWARKQDTSPAEQTAGDSSTIEVADFTEVSANAEPVETMGGNSRNGYTAGGEEADQSDDLDPILAAVNEMTVTEPTAAVVSGPVDTPAAADTQALHQPPDEVGHESQELQGTVSVLDNIEKSTVSVVELEIAKGQGLLRDDSIQQLGQLLADAGRGRSPAPSPQETRDEQTDEFSAYVHKLQHSDSMDQFDKRGRRLPKFRPISPEEAGSHSRGGSPQDERRMQKLPMHDETMQDTADEPEGQDELAGTSVKGGEQPSGDAAPGGVEMNPERRSESELVDGKNDTERAAARPVEEGVRSSSAAHKEQNRGASPGTEESPREWGVVDAGFDGGEVDGTISPHGVKPDAGGPPTARTEEEESDAAEDVGDMPARGPQVEFGRGGARRKKVELDLFRELRERRERERHELQEQREQDGAPTLPEKPWKRVVARRRPEVTKSASKSNKRGQDEAANAELNSSSASSWVSEAAAAESVTSAREEREPAAVVEGAGPQDGAEHEGQAAAGEDGEDDQDEEGNPNASCASEKEGDAKEDGASGEVAPKKEGEGKEKNAEEEEEDLSPAPGHDRFAEFFRPIKRVSSEPEEDEDEDAATAEREKALAYTSWEQSPWLSMTQGVDRGFEAMRIKTATAKHKQNHESSEDDEDRDDAVQNTLFTGRSVLTPTGVYDSVLSRIRSKAQAVDRRAVLSTGGSSAASGEPALLIDSMPIVEQPRPGEVLSPLREATQEPGPRESRFGRFESSAKLRQSGAKP